MPQLTISAAARRCGVPRSTLQRAIRAGRLSLDAQHCVNTEDLERLGYLHAPGAQQRPHADAPPTTPRTDATPELVPLLRSMHTLLQRLVHATEALHTALQDTLQERSSSAAPVRQRRQIPQSLPEGSRFDPQRWVLGRLCPRGHEYQGTGQTLWRLPGYHCRQCENELARETRAAKRRERPS
jgi:hypothetical protein